MKNTPHNLSVGDECNQHWVKEKGGETIEVVEEQIGQVQTLVCILERDPEFRKLQKAAPELSTPEQLPVTMINTLGIRSRRKWRERRKWFGRRSNQRRSRWKII